jgi:hypothetical protein
MEDFVENNWFKELANVLDIVGTNTSTIKGIVLKVLKVIVSTSVSWW